MQYTRPMIELVYEIRRRVPADLKPSIKMANPDMLRELAGYYHNSRDVITKALTKELFSLAGEPWEEMIAETPAEAPKQVVKIYRGQTTLVDAVARTEEKSLENGEDRKPASPQRVYRGQVLTR